MVLNTGRLDWESSALTNFIQISFKSSWNEINFISNFGDWFLCQACLNKDTFANWLWKVINWLTWIWMIFSYVPFLYLFTYLYIYLFIYLFIHSFIYLLIYIFIYLLIYLFIYLFFCFWYLQKKHCHLNWIAIATHDIPWPEWMKIKCIYNFRD